MSDPLAPGGVWLAWAMVLALGVGLAGCTCAPLVEVDACFEDRRDCSVDPDEVRAWDAGRAKAWPQLDALMAGLEPGEHAHPPWQGDADAFWRDMGIDPSAAKRHVFVERDGGLFRIRIVDC